MELDWGSMAVVYDYGAKKRCWSAGNGDIKDKLPSSPASGREYKQQTRRRHVLVLVCETRVSRKHCREKQGIGSRDSLIAQQSLALKFHKTAGRQCSDIRDGLSTRRGLAINTAPPTRKPASGSRRSWDVMSVTSGCCSARTGWIL